MRRGDLVPGRGRPASEGDLIDRSNRAERGDITPGDRSTQGARGDITPGFGGGYDDSGAASEEIEAAGAVASYTAEVAQQAYNGMEQWKQENQERNVRAAEYEKRLCGLPI
jgi:hypothetical protein